MSKLKAMWNLLWADEYLVITPREILSEWNNTDIWRTNDAV